MDMPESLLSKGISIVNTYLLNAIHEHFDESLFGEVRMACLNCT